MLVADRVRNSRRRMAKQHTRACLVLKTGLSLLISPTQSSGAAANADRMASSPLKVRLPHQLPTAVFLRRFFFLRSNSLGEIFGSQTRLKKPTIISSRLCWPPNYCLRRFRILAIVRRGSSLQPSETPALRKTASELSRPVFAAACGVMSFVRPKTSTLSASL